MFENQSGILLINKPINWTSNDVIKKLKSNFNIKKIGHAGTLDPLAKGLLPVLINKGTKYFDHFLNFRKTYIAEITFGFSTDTFDLEGAIINRSNGIPKNSEEIKLKLGEFIGDIKQKPPIYSALKKDGKKLYEYARENRSVEIKARKVNVNDIKIISWNSPKLRVSIECSSGFYVRSFANDLGIILKSFAVLSELERVQYGDFNIKNSIDIENTDHIEQHIICLDNLFINNQSLVLSDFDEKRYFLGNTFSDEKLPENLLKLEDIKIYNNDNRFLGLLTFDKTKNFWKPKNIIR